VPFVFVGKLVQCSLPLVKGDTGRERVNTKTPGNYWKLRDFLSF